MNDTRKLRAANLRTRLLTTAAALTLILTAPSAHAGRLGLLCPPPCAPPPCCEMKTITVEVCHPCTCCKIPVELCIPACCDDCPLVRERCTLIGCGLIRYDWCCGYTAIIRFDRCGGYTVHYRG